MNIDNSKYKWLGPIVRSAHTLKPGESYIARQGHQFDCEPQSFVGALYRIANELGWKATVATGIDRGVHVVLFSFYRADDLMRPNLPAYPIVRKMRGVR